MALQYSGLGVRGRRQKRKYTKVDARQFDLVILDPPRYAKSHFGIVDTVGDYQSLFKPAKSPFYRSNILPVSLFLWMKPGFWCLLRSAHHHLWGKCRGSVHMNHPLRTLAGAVFLICILMGCASEETSIRDDVEAAPKPETESEPEIPAPAVQEEPADDANFLFD